MKLPTQGQTQQLQQQPQQQPPLQQQPQSQQQPLLDQLESTQKEQHQTIQDIDQAQQYIHSLTQQFEKAQEHLTILQRILLDTHNHETDILQQLQQKETNEQQHQQQRKQQLQPQPPSQQQPQPQQPLTQPQPVHPLLDQLEYTQKLQHETIQDVNRTQQHICSLTQQCEEAQGHLTNLQRTLQDIHDRETDILQRLQLEEAHEQQYQQQQQKLHQDLIHHHNQQILAQQQRQPQELPITTPQLSPQPPQTQVQESPQPQQLGQFRPPSPSTQQQQQRPQQQHLQLRQQQQPNSQPQAQSQPPTNNHPNFLWTRSDGSQEFPPATNYPNILWTRPDGSTEFQTQVRFIIAFKLLYLNGSQQSKANIKQQSFPPEFYNNYLTLHFSSGYSCDVEFYDEIEAEHNWHTCQTIYEYTLAKSLQHQQDNPLHYPAHQSLFYQDGYPIFTETTTNIEHDHNDPNTYSTWKKPRTDTPAPSNYAASDTESTSPDPPQSSPDLANPVILTPSTALSPAFLESYTLDPLNTITWLSSPFTPMRFKWKKVSKMKWQMHFEPNTNQQFLIDRL
jgi:hypothetical protein